MGVFWRRGGGSGSGSGDDGAAKPAPAAATTTTAATPTTSEQQQQGKQQPRPTGPGERVVVLPCDDSQHSMHALEWTVRNLIVRGDKLHLLSVVPREAGPYPAEALDSDLPAAPPSALRAWRTEQHAHESETEALLSLMQHRAVNLGVRGGDVETAALTADPSASGVGASINAYVVSRSADMVVLGSRGLHGWQQTWQNLLGLGSVSYFVACHAPCPVVVVKNPADALPGSGS